MSLELRKRFATIKRIYEGLGCGIYHPVVLLADEDGLWKRADLVLWYYGLPAIRLLALEIVHVYSVVHIEDHRVVSSQIAEIIHVWSEEDWLVES